MKTYQMKDVFPTSVAARYNVAVWQHADDDSLFFIGREVAEAGSTGEPDTGVLKLFHIDVHGAIIQEKILWKPIYDGISVEDPRALALPKENLVVGLTAVLRSKRGDPVPFPAVAKIDATNLWKHELPPLLLIDTFGPGKNLTPIDAHTYMFRPDSEAYNHKLLVFSLHSQVPEKLSDIQFPIDLPWASWRMGTTMSPIWLTPTEALFIIHGISLQDIDGKQKYVYSIGRAKLTRKDDLYEVTVARDPMLTPDDFVNACGASLVEELHPELRRVVYSCGGVIKKQTQDKLSLYVNVGDRKTFEVEFSLQELKEGLF